MIWIGLGSNLGDRAANIYAALSALTGLGLEFSRISRLYLTPPWGKVDQPPFLNAVAAVRFDGSATELLDRLLQTETLLGRRRIEKWGPRLIDLDILEFHQQIIDLPHLQVPHPRYVERAFVLYPLRELAPDFIPSGQSLSVRELCERLPPEPIQLYAPDIDHGQTS